MSAFGLSCMNDSLTDYRCTMLDLVVAWKLDLAHAFGEYSKLRDERRLFLPNGDFPENGGITRTDDDAEVEVCYHAPKLLSIYAYVPT